MTIETTNNPKIIKFVSTNLAIQGSYEFDNIDQAKPSPLAQQLFYLPFVKKVYMTANFIAIERYDIVEWQDVQEEVKTQIENYINEGQPVLTEDATNKKQLAFEVYAESTPNPTVMKFVANKYLTKQPLEFKNIEQTNQAPLPKEIFNFPFVKEVFVSENYISITKYDIVEWNEVTAELRGFIRQQLADGVLIVEAGFSEAKEEKTPSSMAVKDLDTLDDISKEIINILDEYVQPAVAGDGGNIAFKSFNEADKTVEVILQGACSGCPSSTMTLKSGIETMLREMLPNKVERVVAING